MAYNKETGMYEGYIYKIFNDVNDKVYIGQTIRTIEIRWKEHCNNSELFDYCLYKSIRKHGINKFHVVCVEKIEIKNKTDLITKLDEREIYWIKYYDSFKNGYNETIGGKDNAPNKFPERPVLEYDLNGKLLYRYSSITDAGYSNNFSRSDIVSCCSRKKVNRVHNKIFRYEDDPLTEQEVEEYKLLYPKIYQYNFDGKLINIFEFIQDAVDYLCNIGISVIHGNICACCNGKILSASGFVWRKYPEKFDTYKTPKVLIIEKRDTFTGKIIEVFNSVFEIEEKYGFDTSTINNCCNKHIHSAYGFHWCYKGCFDQLELSKTQKKIVDQYSLNGDYISTYNSITDAVNTIGISSISAVSTIGAVCVGKRLSAYGFVWRHHGESFDKFDSSNANKIIKINKYDLNDRFIDTYDNGKLAAASVGTTNKAAIAACCKKEREQYKDFKWYYVSDPEQPDKSKIIN
jgi:group I intron endonuclease